MIAVEEGAVDRRDRDIVVLEGAASIARQISEVLVGSD
jgi:hypothetical protein